MSNVTHLLLDEVHERDSNCDLLLAIIREMLVSKRKAAKAAGGPEIHLILMSATLQAESKCFGIFV